MSFDDTVESVTDSAFKSQSLWNRAMSFDKFLILLLKMLLSLNPFGTGQCLSTKEPFQINGIHVSIPLEQGNVFRLSRIGGIV